MRTFRAHAPSPALVVSSVALLIALGGTSYAAFSLPKNSVGTKQLKNNAVTTKKITNNAVTTKKIKNGAVTASKINPSGLTVPNALHANSADSAPNSNHASSADDSAKLGGISASSYQRPGAVLQSRQTEHGVFAGGGGLNDYIDVQVQFDPMLPSDLDPSHTILVTGASATHCPGTSQADAGYLCWYEKSKASAAFLNFGDPVKAVQGANHEGVNVFYTTSGNLAYVYGEWAYTAP